MNPVQVWTYDVADLPKNAALEPPSSPDGMTWVPQSTLVASERLVVVWALAQLPDQRGAGRIQQVQHGALVTRPR